MLSPPHQVMLGDTSSRRGGFHFVEARYGPVGLLDTACWRTAGSLPCFSVPACVSMEYLLEFVSVSRPTSGRPTSPTTFSARCGTVGLRAGAGPTPSLIWSRRDISPLTSTRATFRGTASSPLGLSGIDTGEGGWRSGELASTPKGVPTAARSWFPVSFTIYPR